MERRLTTGEKRKSYKGKKRLVVARFKIYIYFFAMNLSISTLKQYAIHKEIMYLFTIKYFKQTQCNLFISREN